MNNNTSPSHIHSNSRRQLGQFIGKHNHGLSKPILEYNEGMGEHLSHQIY